jgi:hypothetical protein
VITSALAEKTTRKDTAIPATRQLSFTTSLR